MSLERHPASPGSPLHNIPLLGLLGLLFLLISPLAVQGQVTVMTFAGNVSGNVGTNNYGRSDGFGNAASFNNPTGVAMDAAGAITIIVRMRQ